MNTTPKKFNLSSLLEYFSFGYTRILIKKKNYKYI